METFYDPVMYEPKIRLQEPNGTWKTVPLADYGSCAVAQQSNAYEHSCAVGQQSNAYGHSCAVGQQSNVWTQSTHTEGTFNVSYVADLDIYHKHLYLIELKNRGLKGIGMNAFKLLPTVSRDDMNICEEILNNFKTGKMTKFEERLHSALQRKKEIEKGKEKWVKKLKANQVNTKNRFDEQLEKLRGLSTFEKELTGFESVINDIKSSRYEEDKKPVVNPPKEKEVLTNKQLLEYYIYAQIIWSGMYHYFNTIDDINYVIFEFVPSIDEDDERLNLLVKIKVKVLDSEERSTNEIVRQVQDNNDISDFVGNFLGKFSKKKTFIKKVRIEEEKLLKLAKEKYGDRL